MKRSATVSDMNVARIGANIRELRRRMHVSQGDLARRLGMRPGPLCNIEHGKCLPSTPVLVKLARVLDVSADALLQPGRYVRPSGGQVEGVAETEEPVVCGAGPQRARTLFPSCLEQTALKPVLKAGHPLFDMLESLVADTLTLEDLCQVPKQARIPLQLPFEVIEAGMGRLASQMRGLFGVNAAVVFDPLELFENHGLRVLFIDGLEETSSLSFYDARNSNAFLFINESLNPEKQIFSLLYELGRLLLYNRAVFYGENPLAEEAKKSKAARFFAAGFLMPEEAVLNSVRQLGVRPDEWDFDLLLRLKHRFGVSAQAFNYRLLELGLLTPARQAELLEEIRRRCKAPDYVEPGDSRRILSPNGRLGDLLHLALRRKEPEASGIARRLKRLKVRMP